MYLGIYPKNWRNYLEETFPWSILCILKTYMLIAELFTIIKIWKQLKCLSMDKTQLLLLFIHSVWLFETPWTEAHRLHCPSLSPEVCSNSCPLSHDAIQPSHPLLTPSPPALSLSQHDGLIQWVGSSHLVAKVLELQLQHQFPQWIFWVEFV